jgi:hypothetical protein
VAVGFYYFSILSIFPLGIAYGLLLLLFWGIARVTRGMRGRRALLGAVGTVFLALPVAEEFWIAWHFGQACKEAGTFIYKKVKVEGFYDSTMRSAYENTKPGRYRFVEHATADRKGIERVERADDEARDKALAWYAERNAGKNPPKGQSIFYPVSEREQIVVFPNGVDAWRVTRLDHPTARYHYKTLYSHARVAYKVVKHEDLVVDSHTDDVLGRELVFGRYAPWFFVGLDRPVKLCRGRRDVRGSLYGNVLFPVDTQAKGDQR